MGRKKEEDFSLDEYQESVKTWYGANNIIREKSELYHDFIFSLVTKIDETYLGSNAVETQEDMVNHFSWCFNKVLDDFEKERIKFSPASTSTYDYLWYFLYKGFYTSDSDNPIQVILSYFKFLFDVNEIKSPIELEAFKDFYKIFDQNLKKLN